MSLSIEHNHYDDVSTFLSKKIVAYNHEHWDIKQKIPLAFGYRDDNGELSAGISGQAFGNWLSIERLWVSEQLRGKGVGATLLSALENEAAVKGCKFAVVDTLEFQAKPFYQKFGYQLQWQQENYPMTGTRYYLTKNLKN